MDEKPVRGAPKFSGLLTELGTDLTGKFRETDGAGVTSYLGEKGSFNVVKGALSGSTLSITCTHCVAAEPGAVEGTPLLACEDSHFSLLPDHNPALLPLGTLPYPLTAGIKVTMVCDPAPLAGVDLKRKMQDDLLLGDPAVLGPQGLLDLDPANLNCPDFSGSGVVELEGAVCEYAKDDVRVREVEDVNYYEIKIPNTAGLSGAGLTYQGKLVGMVSMDGPLSTSNTGIFWKEGCLKKLENLIQQPERPGVIIPSKEALDANAPLQFVSDEEAAVLQAGKTLVQDSFQLNIDKYGLLYAGLSRVADWQHNDLYAKHPKAFKRFAAFLVQKIDALSHTEWTTCPACQSKMVPCREGQKTILNAPSDLKAHACPARPTSIPASPARPPSSSYTARHYKGGGVERPTKPNLGIIKMMAGTGRAGAV